MWENLGSDKAMELYNQFLAEGMNADDAFIEVYAIECGMDKE